MIEKTIKVLVPENSTSKRDPLNLCKSCVLRNSCLTLVVKVQGVGTLMPLVTASSCSVYREGEP